MVSLVALVIWQLNVAIVLLGFLIFGLLDGLYLSSALTKVPDGAWFTLCLAVFLSSIFVLWRYGKENQWHAEASDRISPRHLLMIDPDKRVDNPASSGLRLRPSNAPISKLQGVGIFFDKTGSPSGTPAVFVHFLQKFQAVPSVVIFFHVRPLSAPTVPPEERFSVSRCWAATGTSDAFPNFFRVIVRHGYSDQILNNDLGLLIYEEVRDFVIREGATEPGEETDEKEKSAEHTSTTGAQASSDKQNTVRQSLEILETSYEEQIVHIVGKEQMRIDEVRQCSGWFRKISLSAFLWLRSNTGSKVANMNLDVEKLVEVGFVKTI